MEKYDKYFYKLGEIQKSISNYKKTCRQIKYFERAIVMEVIIYDSKEDIQLGNKIKEEILNQLKRQKEYFENELNNYNLNEL